MARKPPAPPKPTTPLLCIDGTEAKFIFRPFTGEEPFPSDSVAVAHLLAQLDALASTYHHLLADSPAPLAASISEALRTIDEMRTACEEALASFADNDPA